MAVAELNDRCGLFIRLRKCVRITNAPPRIAALPRKMLFSSHFLLTEIFTPTQKLAFGTASSETLRIKLTVGGQIYLCNPIAQI